MTKLLCAPSGGGTGEMREPTISAYIQCRSNKAALYHSLHSFRKYYEREPVTLVSDAGEDLSRFASRFQLHYYRSNYNCKYGELGIDGAREYLWRIYEHCARVDSDYVVILEEDVITKRKISRFPSTDCGGPRLNIFSDNLNDYLRKLNKTTHDYGYAMCGGSIFDRKIYLRCYDNHNLNLQRLGELDKRVINNKDAVLTVIFLVNGHSYGIWDEVSETNHPIKELRIFRDAAFDHQYKKWYGVDFDEALLEKDY